MLAGSQTLQNKNEPLLKPESTNRYLRIFHPFQLLHANLQIFTVVFVLSYPKLFNPPTDR